MGIYMKRPVMTSVDNEVIERAKDAGLNISNELELHLKHRLSEKPKDDEVLCEFCGKQEDLATRENPIGMTWLCPDEKWICDACLQTKIKKIPVIPSVGYS